MSGSKIPKQHILDAIHGLDDEARGAATVRNFMLEAGLAFRDGKRIRYKKRGYGMFQVAELFARAVHDGEHFKWIPGVYYTHVKAVATRLNEESERSVAIQHDVLESLVKNYLGGPLTQQREERFIAGALGEIGRAFDHFGCDFAPHLPELDVLTKRRSDAFYHDFIASTPDFQARLAWYNENINHAVAHGKGIGRGGMDPLYAAYTERIIIYTMQSRSFSAIKSKKSDANDNRNPARNRPFSLRDTRDHFRLAKYDVTLLRIDAVFPEDDFPVMRLRAFEDDEPAGKAERKTAHKKHQKNGKRAGRPTPRDLRQRGSREDYQP